MIETWYQTRPPAAGRPVVVFDLSAAAAPLWPVLLSTAEGLAELPEPDRPEIGFLGSADRLPAADFLARADALEAAHRGRGRVLAPLFDAPAGPPGRVLLLAARPVVDLPDFAEHAAAGRLIVVALDPAHPVGGGAVPEHRLTDLDLDALAELIRRPAVGRRVAQPGGVPVAWDNPRYRWTAGRLTADGPDPGEVRVAFLAPDGAPPPTAETVYADGAAEAVPVAPASPPAPAGWRPLTPAEATALDAWRSGRPAHCRACGRDHPPGEVVCADGPGLLLPTLAGCRGRVVRVRVRTFQAEYLTAPGPVVPVGPDAVAVWPACDGPADVWRFDPTAAEWQPAPDPAGAWVRVAADSEFAFAVPPAGGGDAG